MKRLRTVALLARQPGIAVLREALLANPLIDLAGVYTHRHLPKAEGGGVRPESKVFETICEAAGVPVKFLDFVDSKNLEVFLGPGEVDLLVAVSWRFLVPSSVLKRLRLGALNLHRGALPLYAGAEPVRRAIEAGERRVAITAHRMTEVIDAGEIISQVWLAIEPPPAGMSAAAYAEIVKQRLEPLYAPLARTAIAAFTA